ncbi:MAG: hypothetical protein R3B90_09820 [Planctomycetaceae bacterium]
MSHELVYTSAPRGLKAGSAGFCTVVSTEGLSPLLQDRLESLSGYRHLFPPGDPRAAENPVVHSHIKISDKARSVNVLSRVADYGLDYSKRTNKLAHHVVLDPAERPAGGPAWLLAQPGLMLTSWDQQVILKRTGRPVPTGGPPIGVARMWKELTGDAGWGGHLAEAAAGDQNRPVYLIFEPGQNLLPLFAESIALLPTAKRWDVTFTTYATGLPQDVKCAWRGILKGSPEEAAARRHPNAIVIDLTQPLGAPPPGKWVEAARTGTPPVGVGEAAPPTLPPTLGGKSPREASIPAPAGNRDDVYRVLLDDEPSGPPPTGSTSRLKAARAMNAPPPTDAPPELPPSLASQLKPEANEPSFLASASKELIALIVLILIAMTGIAWNFLKDRGTTPSGGGSVAQTGHGAAPSGTGNGGETVTPNPGGANGQNGGSDTNPPDAGNGGERGQPPAATGEHEGGNEPTVASTAGQRDKITLGEESEQTFAAADVLAIAQGRLPPGKKFTIASIKPNNSVESEVIVAEATIVDMGKGFEIRTRRLTEGHATYEQTLGFDVELRPEESTDATTVTETLFVKVKVVRTHYRLKPNLPDAPPGQDRILPSELTSESFSSPAARSLNWNADSTTLDFVQKGTASPEEPVVVIAKWERPNKDVMTQEFFAKLDRKSGVGTLAPEGPVDVKPYAPPADEIAKWTPLRGDLSKENYELVIPRPEHFTNSDGPVTFSGWPATSAARLVQLFQPDKNLQIDPKTGSITLPPFGSELGKLELLSDGAALQCEPTSPEARACSPPVPQESLSPVNPEPSWSSPDRR